MEKTASEHFLAQRIRNDLDVGKHTDIVTRFPPEPNGYLHIGHAKSICLNFGLAKEFSGRCNLRFDDTNPEKESREFIDSIQEDVRWLGFDWGKEVLYSSDYFDTLYNWAKLLIRKGKAYVCGLSAEEVSEYRGRWNEAGKNSPDRDRSIEENLHLLEGMKAGEFDEGRYTLRAKIDMAADNMNLRDPAMYRIRKVSHHRTGDTWCIYPTYDFTHGQSDYIEGITHSICTLEFEDHRPLYDWFLEAIAAEKPPHQYEFARLNLSYTVMSKRKLLQLVSEGLVTGWDDPRLPTISGFRRRGYTPESIRTFAERIGVARRDSMVDLALLEYCIREDLNRTSQRRIAILDPIKLVVENWPENKIDELEAVNHPQDPSFGTRTVPFSRELWIERADFLEDAPKKYFRLSVGREVRLRFGYLVTCTSFEKDEAGKITEVRCSYDPETRGGNAPDGRKVKGTITWLSVPLAVPAELRLYSTLFNKENPEEVEEGGSFLDNLNPESLVVQNSAFVEPSLAGAAAGERYQFERQGYFCVDSKDSNPQKLVFNRTVTLRDTWAKVSKK